MEEAIRTQPRRIDCGVRSGGVSCYRSNGDLVGHQVTQRIGDSKRLKIVHHYNDSGFDAYIATDEWKQNPRYAGTFLQETGWVVRTWHFVRDAHKLLRGRK